MKMAVATTTHHSYTLCCVTQVSKALWSWRTRRCEVVRIGDHDYAGQIRVIQADENPSAWRSGIWNPRQCFKPDGKHVRLHFGADALLS